MTLLVLLLLLFCWWVSSSLLGSWVLGGWGREEEEEDGLGLWGGGLVFYLQLTISCLHFVYSNSRIIDKSF